MAKNTKLLVIGLAFIAVLVVGVNIGRKNSVNDTPTATSQISVKPSPTITPTPIPFTYSNSDCGIKFSYPSSLSKLEAPNGVVLTNTVDTQDAVIVTCQADIPRPPLPDDKIEAIKIGSISAKLYHDASAKDGKAVDKLIFTQPKLKKDVYVAGLGATFSNIIHSLVLYP